MYQQVAALTWLQRRDCIVTGPLDYLLSRHWTCRPNKRVWDLYMARCVLRIVDEDDEVDMPLEQGFEAI